MSSKFLSDSIKLPKVPERTTTGFAFSTLDRALKEGLAIRKFGVIEMGQVVSFFGKVPPECVYCGSSDIRRWDHLVPVNKGGDTVIGNMVLACSSCDDSKRDLSFEVWMDSEYRLSPKSLQVKDLNHRLEQLRAYAKHFKYEPRQLESKLNEEELKKLESVRDKILILRRECEALIIEHRNKTGKG